MASDQVIRAAVPPGRLRAFMPRFGPRLAGGKAMVFGAALLGAWEIAGRTGAINTLVMPLPSTLVAAFVQDLADGSLWANIAASLQRVLIGFALSVVVGITLGVFLGWWRGLRETVLPVIEVIRPIPPIAWVPIAILWFGIGGGPAYFIVFIGSVFPVFLNTYSGVRGIDRNRINAALSLGASRAMLFRRVLLPAALPMIMTGLRIGIGVAWMCVVAAELIAAQSGLGYMIEWDRQLLRTDQVMVGMVTVGLLGFLTTSLVGLAERWLLPWREGIATR